jgi:hypothetical protein
MTDRTIDDVIRDSYQKITSRLDERERAELLECGKRAADHVNTMYAFHDWDELRHSVMAIRLRDGSSDGVLYENRRDAVRGQHGNETMCCYLVLSGVGPGGTSAYQMAIYIKMNRDTVAAGYKFPDPDDVNGGLQRAMTTAWKDHYTQLLPPVREPTEAELAPIKEMLREQFRQAGIKL